MPEQFNLECIVHDKMTMPVDNKIQISENNTITTILELNSEEEQEEWIFEGTIDSSKLNQKQKNLRLN